MVIVCWGELDKSLLPMNYYLVIYGVWLLPSSVYVLYSNRFKLHVSLPETSKGHKVSMQLQMWKSRRTTIALKTVRFYSKGKVFHARQFCWMVVEGRWYDMSEMDIGWPHDMTMYGMHVSLAYIQPKTVVYWGWPHQYALSRHDEKLVYSRGWFNTCVSSWVFSRPPAHY